MELHGELVTYKSHDEYNQADRVRSTSLKHIMEPQGPRAYYLKVVNPPINVDRAFDKNRDVQPKVDNMVLGTLLHEYALEGKVNWFVTKYRRGTKAWADEIDEHDGLWALTPTADAQVRAWRESMMRNAEIRPLIEKSSFKEQSFHFSLAGIDCKARVDMFGFDGSIWDLKSTRATDRQGFERQIIDLMYDFSAAFYELARDAVPEFRGMRAPFRHVALSKTFPYYCYVWPLDRSYLRVGRRNVEEAFKRLAECLHRQSQGMDPLLAWPDLLENKQGESFSAPARYLADAGFAPDQF